MMNINDTHGENVMSDLWEWSEKNKVTKTPKLKLKITIGGPNNSTEPKLLKNNNITNKSIPPTLAQHEWPVINDTSVNVEIVPGKLPQAILDIECYTNYFLVLIKIIRTGKMLCFEADETEKLKIGELRDFISKYEIVTFNGNNYDIPMIKYALSGATPYELKVLSDDIIVNNKRFFQLGFDYTQEKIEISSLDIKELLPGMVSLKMYGARLNCKNLQDLPYDPSQILSAQEKQRVKEYCHNDIEITELVFSRLQNQINIRRSMSNRYNIDFRSKSDAQIAESIISAAIYEKTSLKPSKRLIKTKSFYYNVPDFIEFISPQLKAILDTITTQQFNINQDGYVSMSKDLEMLKITVGNTVYKMGMGGLHSTENTTYYVSNFEYTITDADVSSYYPQIILNCGLFPSQLGSEFLSIFKDMVTERLSAKQNGDKIKAETLKICINGSFGKFGSPYSILYAPELLIQVTLTGQLALLMLIEMLEDAGIRVVSANTDGIVMLIPVGMETLASDIISTWENKTNFSMEQSKYSGLFLRDVNNYIAVKYDGKVKTKGCFLPPYLSKNPNSPVCVLAMINYIKYGTCFEDTIRGCTDITQFISVRTVQGGAGYQGKYIGKVARWYYAKGSTNTLNYYKNGNLVPKSYGCKPLSVLPDKLPDDIDYNYYINECYKLF